MIVISWNPANCCSAEPADVGGFIVPGVHFGRSVHNQPSRLGVGDAFAADVPCCLRAPANYEADDVGHVTAADDNAVPLTAEAEEFCQPTDALVLDFRCDRRECPGTAVRIHRRG